MHPVTAQRTLAAMAWVREVLREVSRAAVRAEASRAVMAESAQAAAVRKAAVHEAAEEPCRPGQPAAS